MNEIFGISDLALIDLNIDEIKMNPYQPRKVYNNDDIKSLSTSIRENGLLEPIRVIKKGKSYELLYGHRRLLAVKMLGKATINAIVQPRIIDRLEPALIENMQRKELNALDEAEVFQEICSTHNYSLKDLSQKVDKSVPLLSETLKMNSIPSDVRNSCRSLNHLKFRFLRELSQFGDADSIRTAYQHFLETGKLPSRRKRQYGENDTRKRYLEKLELLISEFTELNVDAEKDRQFLNQIMEQLEIFRGLLD